MKTFCANFFMFSNLRFISSSVGIQKLFLLYHNVICYLNKSMTNVLKKWNFGKKVYKRINILWTKLIYCEKKSFFLFILNADFHGKLQSFLTL